MRDQRIEGRLEFLRSVAKYFASCFVGEFLNVEIGNAAETAKARGPTHHAVLGYLLRRFRNNSRDNTARLEDRVHRRLVRRTIWAFPVSCHTGNSNDHAPPAWIAGFHHVIRGFIKGYVQTMIRAFIVRRYPVECP